MAPGRRACCRPRALTRRRRCRIPRAVASGHPAYSPWPNPLGANTDSLPRHSGHGHEARPMGQHARRDGAARRDRPKEVGPKLVGRLDPASGARDLADHVLATFHAGKPGDPSRIIAACAQHGSPHAKGSRRPFQPAVKKTDGEVFVGYLFHARVHHGPAGHALVVSTAPLDCESHQGVGVGKPQGSQTPEKRGTMARDAEPTGQGFHRDRLWKALFDFNAPVALPSVVPGPSQPPSPASPGVAHPSVAAGGKRKAVATGGISRSSLPGAAPPRRATFSPWGRTRPS